MSAYQGDGTEGLAGLELTAEGEVGDVAAALAQHRRDGLENT